MKTIKFHNKSVSINRVRIGVVVSNFDGTWWGHITGFYKHDGLFGLMVKWQAGHEEFEETLDLVIWE